jgi:hypothetical protein
VGVGVGVDVAVGVGVGVGVAVGIIKESITVPSGLIACNRRVSSVIAILQQ